MSLFNELKRRNVLRVGAAYLVSSWLLIQVAETIFPLFGFDDTPARLVVIVLSIAFIPSMIFAWVFEITPEGLKRDADVVREHSITQATGKKLDRIILVVLALALAYFAFDKFVLDPARDQSKVETARQEGRSEALIESYGDKSIAVLPFTDMSPEHDQEYFSDGITEELLNLLANVQTLRVISRTSSFSFKGKEVDISTIAAQLNVAYILEGSVRKAANKIRITAQLIDARSDTHLWSKNYDRELDDVFLIQDEIASAITTALEANILGHESSRYAKNPTENFGAYDYYLLGAYQRDRRNPEALEKSIELFQQALELDDQFALGYSALALSYLYQAYFSNLPSEKVVELTEPLLDKSLKLDPNLADAHAARASVRLLVRDFAAADAGFRKAIELRPNYAGAWSNLGFNLVLQSRLKEAATAYKKAEELDPLSANLQFNFGALKMLTGRYEEGVEALRKVAEIAPERADTASAIANWSIRYGRYEEAAHSLLKTLAEESDSLWYRLDLVDIYAGVGDWDKAWEELSRAIETSPDHRWVVLKATDLYGHLSDDDDLNRYLASQYEKIDSSPSSRYSGINKARYFGNGFAALIAGDYVQAASDLIESAGGNDGIVNAVYDDIGTLKYLAYTYQKLGQDDAAASLLTQCLNLARNAQTQGWNTPIIHYRTAQIYALQGESDDAIVELQNAVDGGWRHAGILELDPLWLPLQEDTRFQAIIAQIDIELVSMRNQVMLVFADL